MHDTISPTTALHFIKIFFFLFYFFEFRVIEIFVENKKQLIHLLSLIMVAVKFN